MAKFHSARLLDRHIAEDDRLVIRAQTDGGACLDVAVKPEHRAEAGKLWGGNYLSYSYRGGRAVYVPDFDRDD